MDVETEQITITIVVTYSRMGVESKFSKLYIGQAEVPVENRSILQCLDEMRAQGWTLSHSRATADFHGIVCEYDFWRPIAAPQSDEVLSKNSASS